MRLVMTEPAERTDRPYARRWWALLVLCLSLLIIVMANTALTVAAPDMTEDLGLSSADLQWVIDGYTVPYAALMLLLGAIGDKYSRRGALVLGLVVFAGGAVSGYLAGSATGVIAARAVMGAGAAMIMPATLSLLAATFPRAERAKAITLWTATAGLAIAAGPLVAGALLEHHGWSSTFLINVPVAALAIVGALVLVPPSKAGHHGRIDYGGGLLSVVWIGALVYTIIEGPHFGWGAKAVTAAASSRCLVSHLPEFTVVVLSGTGIEAIGPACALARMLQPALVVLEDCDLIAEARDYGGGEQPLLFQILNEMDGLGDDTDVAFLLTTNRADLLEPALAQRPGRVDLAVEIPLPDADGRARLLGLYGSGLGLDQDITDEVVARTEGTTASFTKELVRRSVLIAAERESPRTEARDVRRRPRRDVLSDHDRAAPGTARGAGAPRTRSKAWTTRFE
ncbi:ATP-dependent zinc metalloprotease FtsH [Streptomyces violarus]